MSEKTLKEQYEERKKEKVNNSIVMNQHPTVFYIIYFII